MLDLKENILAIDIGKGTEDIFYYESGKKIENCIQIIRPSRAQILRKQLDTQLTTDADIFAEGSIMGGEPWHIPLYKIAQSPNRDVIMTPNAARSLRYNLEQVKTRGVKIQDSLHQDTHSSIFSFKTSDVDYDWYSKVFMGSDIDIFSECDVVLLACQEHGYPGPNGGSVRNFRMRECYQHYLDVSPYLTSLMFEYSKIPDFAWRLKANADLTRNFFPKSQIYAMDSSPAVVLGTMLDSSIPRGLKTIINIGNGHTLAMIINSNWEVLAIWEHHTGLFKSKVALIDSYLDKLYSNKLNHTGVLKQGGHGYYQRIKKIPVEASDTIVVLGPNRDLMKESKFFDSILWTHPLGNHMLSGPAGLLKTYELKLKSYNDY